MNVFILLTLITITACSEQSNTGVRSAAVTADADDSTSSGVGIVSDQNFDPKNVMQLVQNSWRGFTKRPVVSAASLDDELFMIKRFVVGYRDYLSSKTPMLLWDLPEQADYVELMRCFKDTEIGSAGLDTIALKNVSLSAGMAPVERTNLFRRNDFWSAAAGAVGCSIISNAAPGGQFLDPYAPSGSLYYLARACVVQTRLTDTDTLGSRYCSKQVAVSPVLSNFVNTRINTLKRLQDQVDADNVALTQLGMAWYNQALRLGASIKECEEREYKRAVALVKKKAITVLASASAGLAYQILINCRIGALNIMDVGMFSAELQGITFGQIFSDLASSSEDMPRVCSEAIADDAKLRPMQTELSLLMQKTQDDNMALFKAQTELDIAAGKDSKQLLQQLGQADDPAPTQ